MGNKLKQYVDIMACHPEVTGSCLLCVVKRPNRETIKFIVDCGLFQEEKYNQYNDSFPFDPDNIDFCLVTHNHIDHTGRIPMLARKGFTGKIYTTKQTELLLPLALADSHKVLSETYKRQHKKPIYSEANVKEALMLVKGINYNERIEVAPNIYATFLKNGHLVGAAMILVQIEYPAEETINILFTGDYNNKNEFLDLSEIPEEIRNLRLSIVIESTYGDMSVKEINQNYFKEKVLDAVLKEKTVILPVFSLGRAQEVLYELRKLQDESLLNTDIPIYFDGKLAHKYTGLYLKYPSLIKSEMKNFLPNNVTYADSENRDTLLNTLETKIIVTTSGMGTYGPAQIYIPYFISQKKALILFTGFTAEGTLGAELKEAKEGEFVKIGGLVKKKLADVAYCNQFSAHAKSEELISLLQTFTNIRAVMINHGETNTKEMFAQKVYEEVETPDVAILSREYFFRIGTYGIEKTLSTKFK